MTERRLIVRSALADQVYEALSEQILDMEYAPGQRLVIDRIARELGVSNTPVRDALTRLAAETLIEFAPFRGFTVLPDPSLEEISESFEAREAIERFAVRLGCERGDGGAVQELRRIQTEIARHRYGGRYESFATFVRLNQLFHETLVETSRNRFLVAALRGLYHDALIARTRYGRGVPDLELVNAEHEAIIDALASRDADELEAAVVRHIRDGAARTLAVRVRGII